MRNPLAVGSLMLPVAAFTVSFTPYLAISRAAREMANSQPCMAGAALLTPDAVIRSNSNTISSGKTAAPDTALQVPLVRRETLGKAPARPRD